MVVSILIVFFNLLFLFFYSNKKKKYDNDYLKDKDRFIKRKLYMLLFIINISNIITNIAFICLALSNNYLNIINTITAIIQLLSFLPLLSAFKKYNKKTKIINKKLFNNGDIIFILLTTVLSLIEMFDFNGIHNYYFEFTCLIILLIELVILSINLLSLSGYICFSVKGQDYLEDIKFANKIQINKIINYFVYIISYILFILTNLPYIYILYAIIILLIFYVLKNRIKKVGGQSDKLYRCITIAKEMPGVYYAFYFYKDVYFIRKLLVIVIGLIISIITYYGLGEMQFIYASFAIYNLLLYVILNDKYKLIRYTRALNDELVDKERYSIIQNKKVSYVDTVNILDVKLYKLIIIENVIYESNIILYDPELYVKNIDVRINKSNINDYIFNEGILYQEEIEEEEE